MILKYFKKKKNKVIGEGRKEWEREEEGREEGSLHSQSYPIT